MRSLLNKRVFNRRSFRNVALGLHAQRLPVRLCRPTRLPLAALDRVEQLLLVSTEVYRRSRTDGTFSGHGRCAGGALERLVEKIARNFRFLAGQIRRSNRGLKRYDRKPKRLASRKLYVLQGLPGVGPALAHRLLLEFGSMMNRRTTSARRQRRGQSNNRRPAGARFAR